MVNVYRITLGFDPISSIDILGESVIDAIDTTVKFLKDNGNEIDATIILTVELISQINPLEIIKTESSVEDSFDEDEQVEEI